MHVSLASILFRQCYMTGCDWPVLKGSEDFPHWLQVVPLIFQLDALIRPAGPFSV